jgi:uncharacterized protein (TIGR02271 family)
MTTMQRDEILQKRGADILDRDGEKIGSIEEIYLDSDTNEPEWALVNTGLFGTKSTFVPLKEATHEGEALRVPYEKSQVKNAPRIDPDGELSQREEAELYRHYGLEYSESRSGSGLPEGGAGTTGRTGRTGTTETRGDAGTATGRDDAMTRSEEELRVGKEQREAGRVRLRKYVETEDVQETVPVEREEARVEREPITEANVDEATAGPEISEAEHEVVLREEEPVVEKRAVPKERVRLEKDSVTEERGVSDTVRKERIDVDDDAERRNR